MRSKAIFVAIFSIFCLLFTVSVNAENEHVATKVEHTTAATEEHHESGTEEPKASKFDAGKMILEHISDSHDWHLFGEGHHSVSIPLPVILYSDKGVDVFSSSNFHHGEHPYEGKYKYKLASPSQIVVLKEGTEAEVDKEATAKVYDLSITKNVATLFVVTFLLLVVFLSVAGTYTRNPSKAPKGLQSFVEPIIMFIRDDVAKPSIGKKYEKFMPYLLTVFFFILFANLLGLVPFAPGGANLTGNIAVTMVLALITFIITTINGTWHYWSHIIAMPGVPKPVLIILTPIEILGLFLRPFVLMIRLFANITAGHIIALSFFALIFIFGEMHFAAGYGVSIMSIAFAVFMGLMEVLVAFLQAYVFTLLSAIYFGSAVEEAHH